MLITEVKILYHIKKENYLLKHILCYLSISSKLNTRGRKIGKYHFNYDKFYSFIFYS